MAQRITKRKATQDKGDRRQSLCFHGIDECLVRAETSCYYMMPPTVSILDRNVPASGGILCRSDELEALAMGDCVSLCTSIIR